MKNNYYLAIDIGGTKILIALFNNKEKIIYREKIATPEKASAEMIADLVYKILLEREITTGQNILGQIEGAGICFAGFVEYNLGLVHQAPNLGWDKPVALRDVFNNKLQLPVLLENDANAAVMGEVFYGAAKNNSNVIYSTLSTGIGGGLFLNGRLYRGSSGFAGEVGHTKLFGSARRCNCGGDDCLETWASGSGIEKSASQIWEPKDLGLESITTASIFAEANQGNKTAQRIVEQAVDKISLGLANLVTLLNPGCLVIGGGMAAANPHLIKIIETKIRQYAIKPNVIITNLTVTEAKLGEESGIWGIYAMLIKKADI
jgi:glucokinase